MNNEESAKAAAEIVALNTDALWGHEEDVQTIIQRFAAGIPCAKCGNVKPVTQVSEGIFVCRGRATWGALRADKPLCWKCGAPSVRLCPAELLGSWCGAPECAEHNHEALVDDAKSSAAWEREQEAKRTAEAQPQGGELLPCAHCGSEAQVRDTTLSSEEFKAFWVECGVCEIGTKFSDSPKNAAKCWNTRADLPRATADTDHSLCHERDESATRKIAALVNATGNESFGAALSWIKSRATGEIEAALAELRETYPKRWINVVCATHSAQKAATKVTWTISVDQIVNDFEGPTLADCMAQVRAATRTEGEGEKL